MKCVNERKSLRCRSQVVLPPYMQFDMHDSSNRRVGGGGGLGYPCFIQGGKGYPFSSNKDGGLGVPCFTQQGVGDTPISSNRRDRGTSNSCRTGRG